MIKEKGPEKMIKIDKDELMHFVNIANATFGAFRFEIEDGIKHYFIMSIVILNRN